MEARMTSVSQIHCGKPVILVNEWQKNWNPISGTKSPKISILKRTKTLML
jgi:hypothetical protein